MTLLPRAIRMDRWRQMAVPGWAVSFLFHMLLLLVLSHLLLPPPKRARQVDIESVLEQIPEEIQLDDVSLEPLPLEEPQNLSFEQEIAVEAPAMSAVNPLSEVTEPAPLSPVDMEPLDNVAELLTGPNPLASAALGKGSTFSARGRGLRKALVAATGGTKQTEMAVAAGLDWLARHQYPDGHWSLDRFPCRKNPCTGQAQLQHSDMAATAMGLLPFLAAGHTHLSASDKYQSVVSRALAWMIAHEDPKTGQLGKGMGAPMYTQGLATIALAEAYGLTHDTKLLRPVELAVRFIEQAQNPRHGGWRYSPGAPDGDISVTGWQVMALKSAALGGIRVNPKTLDMAKKFLKSCAKKGSKGGLFQYMPTYMARKEGFGSNISAPRSAIGVLCLQYMGAQRDDPAVQEGIQYILKNMPSKKRPNCYYWYYATQVMHNVLGTEWDRWNRAMRTVLLETQERDKSKCEFGSWDPTLPYNDVWAGLRTVGRGANARKAVGAGRLMTTSLNLLTLEIYYRYLPLYKVMAGKFEMAEK